MTSIFTADAVGLTTDGGGLGDGLISASFGTVRTIVPELGAATAIFAGDTAGRTTDGGGLGDGLISASLGTVRIDGPELGVVTSPDFRVGTGYSRGTGMDDGRNDLLPEEKIPNNGFRLRLILALFLLYGKDETSSLADNSAKLAASRGGLWKSQTTSEFWKSLLALTYRIAAFPPMSDRRDELQ